MAARAIEAGSSKSPWTTSTAWRDDELVRQDLSLIFEVVKNRLAAFFVREKAKGRLAKQADPERIADFCIASMQCAMLMGKVKRSSQTVEATRPRGFSAPQELFSKALNIASVVPVGLYS
jgi:hypothetical protein